MGDDDTDAVSSDGAASPGAPPAPPTGARRWGRGSWPGFGVLVIAAVIIGILAATGALGGTTSPGPSHNAALAGACTANALTLETAASAYDADPPGNCSGADCTITKEVVGALPGDITPGNPATYADSTNAQRVLGLDLLAAWPSGGTAYALSYSATVAGDVSVYVPADSRTPMSFESESATTGCNAL